MKFSFKRRNKEDKKEHAAEAAVQDSSTSAGAEAEEDRDPEDEEAREEETKNKNSSSAFFDNVASNILKIVKTGGSKSDEKTISEIVENVRAQVEQGDAEESASLREIIQLIGEYKTKLGEVGKKYVGHINFKNLSPTAMLYYLEREDEVKNPSWQRRRHRFLPGIKSSRIHELNDFLDLAYLSYVDTAEEIKEGLEKFKTPYDLVYSNVRSSPGKPANFVAVKRDQSSSMPMKKTSPNLRVIIGIRGTKSAADAITDLLCDTVDYKGGKAHSFILESGKYIAEQHRDLLEDLRKKAGKKQVKLTLIGHSLGAGAASIAGMELHGYSPKLKVQVIGFGCPALVSIELAEQASAYITTVVNDADVVPRMSGISVANLLLNMMEFDWLSYAKNDLRSSVEALQARHSRIFRETTANKILQTIEPQLERYLKATILTDPPPYLEPEVFPPGQCIHFYRDGYGFSGNIVPNDFFSEIDVSRRMIDGKLVFEWRAWLNALVVSMITSTQSILPFFDKNKQIMCFTLAIKKRCSKS